MSDANPIVRFLYMSKGSKPGTILTLYKDVLEGRVTGVYSTDACIERPELDTYAVTLNGELIKVDTEIATEDFKRMQEGFDGPVR